jgi:nicotinate-nucleotide--dimethylbenzimidazole phosphoribosyltransferase
MFQVELVISNQLYYNSRLCNIMGGIEMNIDQLIKRIEPLDNEAMQKAKHRLDSLTKPPGSLGVLEDIVVQIAGITGEVMPSVDNKKVLIMAGDNGVAEEGISLFPQSVTTQMVYNYLNGGAAINVLANCAGAEVKVVDVGVADLTLTHPKLISRKVKAGTANITKEPAMSRADAMQAIEVGVQVAEESIAQGADLLAPGEMGIGNTTICSAILAVYLDAPLTDIVGIGTGVNNEGVQKKIKAIASALKINTPDPHDPIDVLAKIGGLEIAAMVGVILEAAALKVPIVLDGLNTGAAALIAYKLCPMVKNYMIPSHISEEPGHKFILTLMGMKPILNMQMRLGEASGAALAFNLINAACRITRDMATFEEAGVSRK